MNGNQKSGTHTAADLPAKWRTLYDLGYSLIPVNPKSKQAAVPWEKYQTTPASLEQVLQWAANDALNIGIVTGAVSGIVILDLDSDAAVAEAERRGLPDTPQVCTARGRHVVFRHPGGNVRTRIKFLPGMDLKGDGGYVVGPGSIHPSGAEYAWKNPPGHFELADMPEWLITALTGNANKPKGTPLALGELNAACGQLRSTAEGGRNDFLFRTACAMRKRVSEGRLDRDYAKERLHVAALDAGLEDRETERTIESGFDEASAQSRNARRGDGDYGGAEHGDARDDRDANGGHSNDCKPEIFVDRANPDRTVAALRDVLAERASDLYDRGGPVRLTFDQAAGTYVARPLTPDGLILEAHRVCRPTRMGRDGLEDATLPPNMARMYLQWVGEWQLRLLNGITTAPLLRDDGSIFSGEGYDAITGMWQQRVPEITVPEQPSRDQAQAALQLLRHMFRTFCFGDAVTVLEAGTSTPVVDISIPPDKDESAFLNALLTAVARASLPLAPGIMISAALVSGAGAGKGLLSRLLSSVAFGFMPHAVTAGGSAEELEKRIAAELVAGSPVVFLDNLNSMSVKSDQLASAITERPARVRILGKTETATLNSSALIILTGNGLNVSEDLARRFLFIELDPRTEDPEARQFVGDLLAEVQARRTELLGALLTIWRWGRNDADLPVGRPMGSFDIWSRWVRDPLLALGCQDPADRIREAKDHDSRRQDMVEMFDTWFTHHRNRPVRENTLAEEVKRILDPSDRGRQFRAARLTRLTGTRVGGYVLTRQEPAGKRGACTYALIETGDDRHPGHPGHNTSDDGNSAAAGAATGWKTRI